MHAFELYMLLVNRKIPIWAASTASSVWKYAFHYLDRSFLKTLDHWCRCIACVLWLAGHWLTVEQHKGKEKEAWFLCVRLRCALPSRSIAVDRVQAGRPGSGLIARHMDKLDRASAPPSDRSTCKAPLIETGKNSRIGQHPPSMFVWKKCTAQVRQRACTAANNLVDVWQIARSVKTAAYTVLGKVGKPRVIVYSLYSTDVLSYGWKRSKIISLFLNRIIIVAIGIYNTERK
jgi:hypothetical protein